MNDRLNDVDLAQCFYFAAMTLCGDAFDKLNKNGKSPQDLLPSEYCHGNVIVAFYLYRYALEIQIKKLALALKLNINEKLEIKALWQFLLQQNNAFAHICGIEEIKTNLNNAMAILDSYELNAEELFEYERFTEQGRKNARRYKAMNQRDCEALLLAYYDVRYLMLCVEETKFCVKSTNSLLYELENAVG